MGFEIVVFLVIVAAAVTFVVVSTKMARAKKNAPASDEKQDNIVDEGGRERYDERNIFTADSLKERLAPDACDTSNPEYLYICDMGNNFYIRSFYVEQMPLNVTFATTFRALFQFSDKIAQVPIVPLDSSKAIEAIKRNIKRDDAEIIDAEKRLDSSRVSEMQSTRATHLQWLDQLSSGQKSFFEVAFLFTLKADSLEKLRYKSTEFVALAKRTGLELCSCFGWQDLAYQANAPYNTLASRKQTGSAFSSKLPIKWHILDENAVATIYNHTSTHFTHPNGIMAGHNLDTGEIINIDFYHPAHNGYSVAVMGQTGCGKSLMCKVYIARLAHFGYRFACIDTDRSNGRGEYSGVCDAVDGVNFELRSNSPNRLNIFEVDEQLEYDAYMKRTSRVLRLTDKASDIYKVLLYVIQYHKTAPDAATATFMEGIIKECVAGVYEEKGIYDGDPDSLYVDDTGYAGGVIGSGRRRKELPTMSDAYLWLMRAKRANENHLYDVAYQMLEVIFADLVDDLYYDCDTLERVPKAEYDIQEFSERRIERVHGTRGYFDGQSSIAVNSKIPFINIDISDLPDDDKVLGQQVAMSFLIEHFIKKNSSRNVADGRGSFDRLVMIVDEAHRMFDVPESRKFLSDQVRTARKNNSSIWLITQNYTDYQKYEETRDILRNVAMMFMFKQNAADRKILEEKTVLTSSAVSRLLKLGGEPSDSDKSRKGEVCVVDGNSVVFMKVDYLERTEAVFAETDASRMQKIG